MAVDEAQQFCTQCQRYVLARRPGTNHVFHLLMCVFTCGLWVIVWFLRSAKTGGWRCSVCGGSQFGYAQQGGAPAKSGIPKALMLIGMGLGGFFALVLFLGMCSVVRSQQKTKDATIAESQARARDNAAAAAKAPPVAPVWQEGPDVMLLAAILAGNVKPDGVDRTGEKLEIESYSVPGWSVAQIARFKKARGAWSIHVTGGSVCSVDHWAPSAMLRADDGSLPMQAKWYRLSGGPLDGLVVKAFTNVSSECAWHFATPEYAALQNWEHRQ